MPFCKYFHSDETLNWDTEDLNSVLSPDLKNEKYGGSIPDQVWEI